MENSVQAVADQLNGWFDGVLRLADESVFSIAPRGPHRDAVLLDILKKNARILSENGLDDKGGKFYSPLCFFLAAALRKLGASLGAGHWRAALENVMQMQQQVAKTKAASASLGLEIGTPLLLFKQQFDEAVNQTALVGGVSYLSKENRDVALGLAVNWGIRLLLAYAVECGPFGAVSDRKDLVWISHLVRPLVATAV